MKAIFLGTGAALVTEYYSTSFVLKDEAVPDRGVLVDGGGGDGILKQMKLAGVDWRDLRDIYITHRHCDHIMGIIWVVREICQHRKKGKLTKDGSYCGPFTVHGHAEVISILKNVLIQLLSDSDLACLGKDVLFDIVGDGESREMIGHEFTFFDVRSTKASQFGFVIDRGTDHALGFCGDEPYAEHERPYLENCLWLMHEAFCPESLAGEIDPHSMHHSTVRDAAENAESIGARKLILFHTEGSTYGRRREIYTEEGRKYFSGDLCVPDDLETIDLW